MQTPRFHWHRFEAIAASLATSMQPEGARRAPPRREVSAEPTPSVPGVAAPRLVIEPAVVGATRGALRRRISVVALLALLVGCSVKRERVTTDNVDAIAAKVGADSSVTQEERQLFAGYVVRSRLAGMLGATPPPLNITVGEAIEAQRRFVAERHATEERERAEAERAERQRQAEIQAIRSMVSARLTAVDYQRAEPMAGQFEDYLHLRIHVRNQGTRALRGVRGALVFHNTFGQVVARVDANIERDLAPSSEDDVVLSKTYNQFRDEDRAMRNFDLSRGRVEWEPEQIVFADGTQVEVAGRGADQRRAP